MRTLRLPFISVIFQAHLGLTACIGAREIKLYENLTLCPHATHGYRVKLQHQKYTERHTTYDTCIYTEKSAVQLTSVGLAYAHPNNILGKCRTLWGERE